MQVLIVGAGVVGLAIAREAAKTGHDVIVAEAGPTIGSGTSSRNSEVIHAGIYYPTGSLRARHCTRGRRMLYAYCQSHGIPHRRCGKLIVATKPSETTRIEQIMAQGLKNGVEGLKLVEGNAAQRMEPALSCVAAVHSPETGIIDSHRYMLALQGDLEVGGGSIAFNTPVERISRTRSGWVVHFSGSEPGSVVTDAVVNSAGHGAQALARATEDFPPGRVPPLVLAKGNYFGFAGRPAFSRLIYPAPVDGGLGVHVTLDLAGRMRFGPDVEWIDEEAYDVDPRRADAFYASIRTYWPALPDQSLVPDYSGIRPKLTGPGEAPADFLIDTPADHGLPGLVHLFGIESPGLTSAMSLAEEVVASL
jgi:L-2-hydroxyglutarate oxidase LhgO